MNTPANYFTRATAHFIAAVVERRTGDTAKLIYRQVFPTRYHAAKTARAAVKSHAANHAFTN